MNGNALKTALAAATVFLFACDVKSKGTGSVIDIPVDREISVKGIDSKVEVIRDTYGVPHIYGASETDVAFVQGYLHAQDRLFQMVLQRAAALGELSVLLGAGMIVTDIQSRTFKYKEVAKQLYSGGFLSSEEKAFLESYAAGVNTFLSTARPEDLPLEFLGQGISDPNTIYEGLMGTASDGEDGWHPVDSLAFARLMTFQLSFDNEGSLGDEYATIQSFLSENVISKGAATAATSDSVVSGMMNDLYTTTPVRNAIIATPGSSEPFERSLSRGPNACRGKACLAPSMTQPPRSKGNGALKSYVQTMTRITGIVPNSNNWVVSADLSATGFPMLANDPHLSLQQPPIFHEVHINTEVLGGGNLNAAGVMFPMAPGVVIGFNQNIAWGETVAGYDVTDFYVETVQSFEKDESGKLKYEKMVVSSQGQTLSPKPAPADSLFFRPGSGEKPCPLSDATKKQLDEMFISYSDPVYFEPVNQCKVDFLRYEIGGHGPIVRIVLDDDGNPASLLTVRWTGFEPSNELAAFKGYLTATDINDFKTAVSQFKVGAQNQVVIDSRKNFGWFPNARLPNRDAAACGTPLFLPQSKPECDWNGFIDESKLPSLENPKAGFIATANNQTTDAQDYYHGSFYDVGYRGARIAERLKEQAPGSITVDEMKKIQGDTRLLICEDFRSVLTDDLTDRQGELSQTAIEALGYLERWNCDSPSGFKYDPDDRFNPETGGLTKSENQAELEQSAAASVFHSWLSNFAHFTFDDQLGGETLGSSQYARALYHITYREECTGAATQTQPCQVSGDSKTRTSVFWDDWGTTDVEETRADISVKAYNEAIAGLDAKFGTSNVLEWLWGRLHTLTVRHLADSASVEGDSAEAFSIPSPSDLVLFGKLGLKGFPRPGGFFVVDSSQPGFNLMTSAKQSDFSYGSGPSYRMIVEMTDSGPNAHTALPGGNVANLRSTYYDNQLREFWWANDYKKFPFTREELKAEADTLIVFQPAAK